MKIKKRTGKKKRPSAGNEIKVFFIVILIILFADVVLFGVVFPNIRDMLKVPGQETGSSSGVSMSMAMIVILIDIVLVVPLYMVFSRVMTKRGK